MKLFNIVRPDRAYFGQKDAQQVRVIEKMVADLDLGLEVVAVPTPRRARDSAPSSNLTTNSGRQGGTGPPGIGPTGTGPGDAGPADAGPADARSC